MTIYSSIDQIVLKLVQIDLLKILSRMHARYVRQTVFTVRNFQHHVLNVTKLLNLDSCSMKAASKNALQTSVFKLMMNVLSVTLNVPHV